MIQSDLNRNLEHLRGLMGNSSDFVIRELTIHGPSPSPCHTALCYLDGMIDKTALLETVIPSLLDRSKIHPQDDTADLLAHIRHHVMGVGEISSAASLKEALDSILSGGVLLLVEGSCTGLLLALSGWKDRGITESQTQSVIRGPQEAFTDTLRTNTTQVRRRVRHPGIRIISKKIGTSTRTDVAVMYLEGSADPDLVVQITNRLDQYPLDRVLESEYLEEWLLADKQKSVFPTIYNTDRPDTIAAGLLDGKIAIFVDGTPFVLLAPALFIEFIHSSEDYYQSNIYSNVIRVLRYISLLVCLLAPSVYIALTTYHQDMLPTQLLLSLAAQREGIPFPAFVEALLMEVTFEILREAGLRMPRTIGQAVSIVGTIVIGQAAVEANIVSAVMVIIVSITAISSFVIPSYTMSIALRLLRFGFMGLSATFGAYGITIGLFILILHLCSLESVGVPYLSPLAPYSKSKQKDALLRFPHWAFRSRRPKV
ncbi:spore germination protein [Paenibacillus mucilaginosus]|nr:spore germination protein [Paenibacillus mucilaginosus]